MTVKSELDRQRLSYIAFKYDSGSNTFQGYDGTIWKIIDNVRYNSGSGLFEGWNGTSWITISSDTSAEYSARVVADSSLQANITLEASARTVADSSLSAAIDVEMSARKVADSSLYAALDVEVTARTVADSSLQANITLEASARTVADSSLQGNINTEYSARVVVDSSLQTNINNLAPGLEIVATTAASINGTTLANRKHYLIDMSAATGDILASLPAIAAKQNIKVEVYNNTVNGYRCVVDTTGAELIVYDGTGYDSVLVGPLESWIEFASNTTNWVAEDAVGGTVFATVGVVFKTTSYLAAAWDDIGADTTGGGVTITLPSTPTQGQLVRIRDVGGVSSTNNITVARNGNKIAGLSSNFTVNTNWADISFVYYNTSIGWAPVNAILDTVFRSTAGPHQAVVGTTIGCDTSTTAITITAPASPTQGQTFRIKDVGGNASINNITVARNASNIAGVAADFTIDSSWIDVLFTYYNATVGWAPTR